MTLQEILAASYAAVGQDMSDLALETIASDLEAYPLEDVRYALSRCRKELKRVTLSDILDRLPNGHPGPEEAWSMLAQTLDNESMSIVWTEPMRLAASAIWPLRDDPIAARMAFKEAYIREVAEEREAGNPVSWSFSPGDDAAGRHACILENVKNGRLAPAELNQLPEHIAGTIGDNDLLRLAKAAIKRIE